MRERECQRALTQKQTKLWGGGALQRCHDAPFEPLAQLGDTLRGVGPPTIVGVDATKCICSETAMGTSAKVSAGADMKANAREARFECPSSLLERLQRRVALQALGERGSAFWAESVLVEPVRERWGENGQRAGVRDRSESRRVSGR